MHAIGIARPKVDIVVALLYSIVSPAPICTHALVVSEIGVEFLKRVHRLAKILIKFLPVSTGHQR